MNRVALITGASRGIGKEAARHFASKGYDLILLARDAERLQEVAASLSREHQVVTHWNSVDVCEHEAVNRVVQREIGHFGRLDVLVNAAGIFRFGTKALSNADLDAMLATNLRATHNLCSACCNALKASHEAHIFNIASIAGVQGFAPIGGYAASKFALVGYGQSLARELLCDNVRVTTLCPDVVDTDMGAGSGLASEQMIAPEDLTRTMDYVMSLSPSAVVDQVVLQCKTMLEMANVR